MKILRGGALGTAVRVAGLFGWFEAVLYICRYSLHYYRDDSMLASVTSTFLISALVTSVIFAAILLCLDVEGLLSDKIFRWLPGLFMAESGIALSLCTAATMTIFAAVAGVAFAFGTLAVITGLLRVKVGKRLRAIGIGLGISALLKWILAAVLGKTGQGALIYAAVIVGVAAALTVHFSGYTKPDAPLCCLAEMPPARLLRRVPNVYVSLFICSAAFYAAEKHIEPLMSAKLPLGAGQYEYAACIGFGLACFAAGLLFKFRHLPMLFVAAAGLAAAGAALSGLSNTTPHESMIFALVNFAAAGIFKVCAYVVFINFSIDRPHPIFYAALGFSVATAGELCGGLLARVIPGLELSLWVLVILMPLSGWLFHSAMKRESLTQDKLDHYGVLRQEVEACGQAKELTEGEMSIFRHVVLDKYTVDELSEKLLLSHNTVRVRIRGLLQKLDMQDMDVVKAHFEGLADATEAERKVLKEQAAEDRKAYKAMLRKMREAEREQARALAEDESGELNPPEGDTGEEETATETVPEIEDPEKPVGDVILDIPPPTQKPGSSGTPIPAKSRGRKKSMKDPEEKEESPSGQDEDEGAAEEGD